MPDLFPRPRTVRHFDPTVRHDHAVQEVRDPSLAAQGFAVHVDDERAVLRSADEAGARSGRRTVAQLRDDLGRLPTVDIEDHPDLAVRGFMLDVSRDRVPTRRTLDRLVDVLATCRYNHLQLYVEHTFAYRDHAEVWAHASPLDPADLRWLRDRCREEGIELAANQNCFGHFGRWLALDRYRHRAECPDGFELLAGVPMPAGVLAPTAENAELVVSLVREQVAAFDARIVNVGCDETFELGKGASADRVAVEGAGAVYAAHLRRILAPLVADGLEVQYWGDVVARHPEQIGLLPAEGTTALVWNYDAPEAPTAELPAWLLTTLADAGIDLRTEPRFETRLRPFVDAGVRHWVAPGTSSWNSLVGRIDNARGNLLDAARGAVASGAEGYLVTDWGDGGHHQPLTVSYPSIAYGGAVAWGADANADLDVTTVIDRDLLGDDATVMGGVLDRIGRVAARTGVVAVNASPLHAALFPTSLTIRHGDEDPDGVRDVLATLDAAVDDLARARPAGPDGAAMVEELTVAIELARVAAQSMGATCGLPVASGTERAADLDRLIGRYRAAWLTTSRPGGLDDSTAHLVEASDHLRSVD